MKYNVYHQSKKYNADNDLITLRYLMLLYIVVHIISVVAYFYGINVHQKENIMMHIGAILMEFAFTFYVFLATKKCRFCDSITVNESTIELCYGKRRELVFPHEDFRLGKGISYNKEICYIYDGYTIIPIGYLSEDDYSSLSNTIEAFVKAYTGKHKNG